MFEDKVKEISLKVIPKTERAGRYERKANKRINLGGLTYELQFQNMKRRKLEKQEQKHPDLKCPSKHLLQQMRQMFYSKLYHHEISEDKV